MFGKKTQPPIKSLIAQGTRIEGNVKFSEGLRVDGEVFGDIQAAPEESGSMLVISEQAKVEGEVRVAQLVVNGEITGPVYSSELLELQPKARITGDVYYKALEMHGGALVSGKLTHDQVGEPILKLALAASNT